MSNEFKATLEYAKLLDKEDKISHLRNDFHIPKDHNDNEWIYMCGNSLGLQPKLTKNYILPIVGVLNEKNHIPHHPLRVILETMI